MATREDIMTALLAKVQTVANFQTVSRRIVLEPGAPMMTVAAPPAQPALYLFEDDEDYNQKQRGLTTRTLNVLLWIWAKIPDGHTPGVPDGTTPGATILNNLLDALETAFKPDSRSTNSFTLSGLVQHCWIEGRIAKVPGDINPDGQCLLIVPVKLLAPFTP